MNTKKLPLIHVLLGEDGQPAPVMSDRQFSVMASKLPFKEDRQQAQYLPRVACRTCPNFHTFPSMDKTLAVCRDARGLSQANADGSDFCHLHPELAHLKE